MKYGEEGAGEVQERKKDDREWWRRRQGQERHARGDREADRANGPRAMYDRQEDGERHIRSAQGCGLTLAAGDELLYRGGGD